MSDRMDLDKHVGKRLFRIEMGGVSPSIRAIASGEIPDDALMAAVNADLRAVFAKHFMDMEVTADFVGTPLGEIARIDDPSELIEPKAERDRKWEENREALGEIFRAADAARIEGLKNHPDNGKQGWWLVDGVRHDARVQASSALEAVEKAIAAGEVGDWESPTAEFVGEAPEVM